MAEKLEALVARRIRELRTQRGLSIRQLALRAGLPPEMVSRAERRVSSPSVGTLGHLCTGLGVDPAEFFSQSTQVGATAPAATRRLEGLVAELTPEEQDDVTRGVELLLGVRVAAASRKPQRRRRARRTAR